MQNKIIIILSLIIFVSFLVYSFITNKVLFENLILFTFVGVGLGFLRLIINGFIKKTKGKPIYFKIIFFAALLSFGIPFQNCFRKNVILTMEPNLILPTIIYTIVVVILISAIANKQNKDD